jgi:acetyl-CoA acetyltransferase family protein
MPDVVIVEAIRTPVGRRNGNLSGWHPVELGAFALERLVERAGIAPEMVDDVIMGCVTQTAEQGSNIGRLIALRAGFPVEVPAVSINRMCGSSQQAVHFANQAIASGDMDMVIAAGVESMSRVKIGSDWDWKIPPGLDYDLVHQGISAELMAEKWELPRSALDQFAYESHAKAAAATKEGRFEREILPIEPRSLDPEATTNGENGTLTYDETIPFEPNLEKMATLSPAFKEGGVITAANSSQISDGAAAILLTTPKKAAELGLRPRARVISRVSVGSDPVLMLSGPIPATEKALAKVGLTIGDMDAIEINEAFASVVLAWAREIEPPMERVNPNGGAIALGHPLGASGAKLMTTLLYELERIDGRYGLQTMCIGHGLATATIIERLN